MRIRIAFNSPTRLAESSIRYDRYLDGFRRLGHDAALITTAFSAEGVDYAEVVPDTAALHDSTFWSKQAADLVVLPTWLGMPELLASIRPHTHRLVALTDSDGYIGARVHPRQLLKRMWSFHSTLSLRLRSAFWWARQYLGDYRRTDAPVLAAASLCDRQVVFSPAAKANLSRFYSFHGRPEMNNRIQVVPYPVDEAFEHEPVSLDRDDVFVAIGRWWDAQKAAGLLSAGVARYLSHGGKGHFVLLGTGGDETFRSLLEANAARVEYRGTVPPKEVAVLLGRAKVLLSTSRWESGPIVAAEALLRGCSLVGPEDIPGFAQMCDGGTCGTTFRHRSAAAVADALKSEADSWTTGRRQPTTIAARWQGYFTPEAVCRQLLSSLDTL